MARLDDALIHLRGLATRPPFPPATPGELSERVARRRRRRTTAGSFLAVVALGSAVVVASARDGQVATDAIESTTTQVPATLIVEPSNGLQPDDEITITLPDSADPADIIVAQCGSEAATASPEQWCSVVATETGGSPSSLRIRAQRVIQVSAARIDCAERPGRCLIGVRTGGRDFTAPISFAPGQPALGVPTLDARVQGNGFVALTGEGDPPTTEITITQCRPTQDQEPADPVFHDCDFVRAARITADDRGRLRLEIPIYRDIFESYTGWGPCDPCQIEAHGATFDTVAAPIDASTGLAGRPTVSIEPPGPYAPGQLVQLHGTGFPPDTPFDHAIGWCRFVTEDPTTEVSGGGPQYASCRYPETDPLTTSDTGEFTIVDFPLPDASFVCDEPDARCGLAVHPSEGSLPLFVTEFTIAR
jgi:urease gamma subunit